MSKDNVIELVPDADGVFVPAKSQKKKKKTSPVVRQQQTSRRASREDQDMQDFVEEFMEGFKIGESIVNTLLRRF